MTLALPWGGVDCDPEPPEAPVPLPSLLGAGVAISKIPSIESLEAFEGAGERLSRESLASLAKIAVVVDEMLCSRLMTVGPAAASAATVKLSVKSVVVVPVGIVPVPVADEAWKINWPGAGRSNGGETESPGNIEPSEAEFTVNSFGS